MQTRISSDFKNTAPGQEADSILRTCVHCGFCTATCPTYLLLGDELDGPRGRIYLIKQLLEGYTATEKTQQHLDRCLTCRNCESTCPSGVNYHRLLDIGRNICETAIPRSATSRLQRFLLRKFFLNNTAFTLSIKLARLLTPVLPSAWTQAIPRIKNSTRLATATEKHERKILILDGCVQPALQPDINYKTEQILNHLNIEVIHIAQVSCCGALSHHLSAETEALTFARNNIDHWWPHIEQGAEAIITTASGCGSHIKDYAKLLAHLPDYASKAETISQLCKDIAEIIQPEDMQFFQKSAAIDSVAWHPPCSLQHGQQINGVVEKLLSKLDYQLVEVTDQHLCCGSAGTYSILQADISSQLLENKLDKLQRHDPDIIATANIGCHTHLLKKSSASVCHWIELLEPIN
ncbi:MAG: glycolate oxidase subunit GlcF [Gammaproteobacteria bacterium]|nr:glycolate oxidase subunit GlcF [Gammaproteobacteria bacterium]